MTDVQTPAGWYADPSGDTTKLRYWDGANWTEQTSDVTASINQASQPIATPAGSYTQPTAPSPTNPYQQAAPGVQPSTDRSGAATAALICGIVGIPGALFIALIGYVLGIIAIVMGVRSRTSSKKTLATAGIILGIVALIIALINSILGVILFSNYF